MGVLMLRKKAGPPGSADPPGSAGREADAGDSAGRSSRRSLLLAGLAAAAAGLSATRLLGAAARGEADTSAAARDEAIRTLPLSEMTAESRRKLMAVCERPTIFRRLPPKSFACDPAMHQFLIRNPEVVVGIWQLMGVANMSAERQSQYVWKASDGSGTACDVELIYGTDEMHVVYTDGFYEGSLLRHKVTGRCVLLLRTGCAYGPDRRPYLGNRLDLFVQIDNLAADVVARTLSPYVGKVADANFHESCVFVQKLSEAAERNGPGVQRLAEKLKKVDPPVREEFSRVALSVGQRAAMREPGGAQRR